MSRLAGGTAAPRHSQSFGKRQGRNRSSGRRGEGKMDGPGREESAELAGSEKDAGAISGGEGRLVRREIDAWERDRL